MVYVSVANESMHAQLVSFYMSLFRAQFNNRKKWFGPLALIVGPIYQAGKCWKGGQREMGGGAGSLLRGCILSGGVCARVFFFFPQPAEIKVAFFSPCTECFLPPRLSPLHRSGWPRSPFRGTGRWARSHSCHLVCFESHRISVPHSFVHISTVSVQVPLA